MMFKKLLLAAFAAGLVSGATVPLQVSPVEAAVTCKDAAKMSYPNDRKLRRDMKKECKAMWKASVGK